MLYKRKDSKFWWYRFVVDGTEYAASTRTANKRLAGDFESAARVKVLQQEAGILPAPTKHAPTLEIFSKRFVDQLFIEVKNRRTRKYYLDAWKKLLASPLAETPLAQIKPAKIDEFKSERVKAGDTVYMINPALRALRRALHMAERWEVISRAPKIGLLTGEEHRDVVISDGELAKILQHCEPTMRDALILLYETGLRPGELCQLRWTDIHAGYIELAGDKTLKTVNAKRKIPLTARAQSVLTARRGASDYVFVRTNGKPLDVGWLSHRFIDARRLAELPEGMVLYSCRHTFLTRLARTGIGLFSFMQIAGHSSPEISKRYVHQSSDDDIRRAGQLLDRTFNGTGAAQGA